ncbi:MAG: phosphohistidine phosphatase SixA [Rhodospirillales bacterium]
MRLYLVQHGEAVAKEVHPDRPLTDKGRDDVRLIGALLAGAGVAVARVVDSGKVRARQTAESLAAAIAPGIVIEDVASGLAPKDSSDWLAAAAERWAGDTLVVGHLPFLERAVARLVCGRDQRGLVAFRPGSVVCLERREDGSGWTIAWMVRPELIGR